MSRFRKLSHSIWHCQYHIIWVPKYRHRILTGPAGNELSTCIRAFSDQKQVEIVSITQKLDSIGAENASVRKEFLNGLLERGLTIEEGVLCVMDGSKGIRRAVEEIFGS